MRSPQSALQPSPTAPGTAIRVVLVEDSEVQARFLQQLLHRGDQSMTFDVVVVDRLDRALRLLTDLPTDLVLLDLMLPDSEGLDTFAAVHQARPDLPIIVLSGAGDERVALDAVASGAQDYLAKRTVSPELLARAIRYALERHRNLIELRRLALVDALTGAYNRRGFLHLAEQQVAVARRSASSITMLFLDIDRMKRVNDTYGHEEGDRALVDVASLMMSTFRASDVIGRIGGDEFCALLLDDGSRASNSEPPANRLEAAIELHNQVSDRPFELSCSIGAVTLPSAEEVSTVTDLLSAADHAMYETRHASRHEGGGPAPARIPGEAEEHVEGSRTS